MPFGRVGLARGCEPPFELALDQLRIFEQTHNFRPHDLVQNAISLKRRQGDQVFDLIDDGLPTARCRKSEPGGNGKKTETAI
jgi:hypothetical protein